MKTFGLLLFVAIFAITVPAVSGQTPGFASTDADELTFQTVFGLPSAAKDAPLVVAYHLEQLGHSICPLVSQAQADSSNVLYHTLEQAGVESLRSQIALAQRKQSLDRRERKVSVSGPAEAMLRHYYEAMRAGGLYKCR